MGQWIVVRTKSQRERYAAENVHRQGMEYYLPFYEHITVKKGCKLAMAKVLFPCHLFVKIEARWRVLLSTFGVSSVILRGDGPATMQQSVIDDLKHRHDKNGLIALPTKNGFENEQRVRVKSGPFSDHVGLYQGQTPNERNKVLLDFLGGKRIVLVPKGKLEAA